MSGLILPGRSGVGAHGHFKLTTRDAETGQIHEEVEGDNLITTAGLLNLAAAFVYNVVLNQNALWGAPIPTNYGNLGDCYGALGTSSTTPTAGDVGLGNEVGRAKISNASIVGPSTVELDFFFGTSTANQTLTEGGVLINSTFNMSTLTAPLTAGTNYTSIAVNPFLFIDEDETPETLPSGQFMVIGYGAVAGQNQFIQTSSTTAYGATTVNFTAVGGGTFTAAVNYPVGTPVFYGPTPNGQVLPAVNGGTLFDHTIFGSPTVKNSAETATLALQISLASA